MVEGVLGSKDKLHFNRAMHLSYTVKQAGVYASALEMEMQNPLFHNGSSLGSRVPFFLFKVPFFSILY